MTIQEMIVRLLDILKANPESLNDTLVLGDTDDTILDVILEGYHPNSKGIARLFFSVRESSDFDSWESGGTIVKR